MGLRNLLNKALLGVRMRITVAQCFIAFPDDPRRRARAIRMKGTKHKTRRRAPNVIESGYPHATCGWNWQLFLQGKPLSQWN